MIIQEIINSKFPPSTHPFRRFERVIDQLLPTDGTVLEIGCGRGAKSLTKLKGKAGRLIGIDLVEFTNQDPSLDLIRGDGGD